MAKSSFNGSREIIMGCVREKILPQLVGYSDVSEATIDQLLRDYSGLHWEALQVLGLAAQAEKKKEGSFAEYYQRLTGLYEKILEPVAAQFSSTDDHSRAISISMKNIVRNRLGDYKKELGELLNLEIKK